MLRYLLVLTSLFMSYVLPAQNFTGTGGNIPDGGPRRCFPITVTGVGNIDGSYGLAQVCINISHAWDSDLEIILMAPDGTTVPLSLQNGGSGNNYNGTCFTATALTPISAGNPPFAGTYLPQGYMGAVNNGQNADGNWSLCIEDITGDDAGTLNDWSITFNNTPAPPIPSCSGNAPAGNTCATATPVCNFNGFCGNTSSDYTANQWNGLANQFCGTVENNSFVTFVASATSASFNIFVTNSLYSDGIQMMFFDGGCGSGPVTSYGCATQILPTAGPTLVTASGLTPGNSYYLMIDGYAGDVCDYTISAASGVNILNINPSVAGICPGNNIRLTASGGNGGYSWSPATGLSVTTGAVVFAAPAATTTYTVSSTAVGVCPLTSQVTVTVNPKPALGNDTSLVICAGNSVNLLSLFTTTGLTSNWTTSGGPVSNPASVTVSGVYQLIATNTSGCADTVLVTITVHPKPALGADTTVHVCQGSGFDLTAVYNTTGLTTDWFIETINIPNPGAVTVANSYQLIASNTYGCSDTALATLLVDARPVLGPDKTIYVCPGTPVDLTAQFLLSGLSQDWTLSGGPVADPSAANTAGSYEVIATNAAGCKDTALVIVIDRAKPNLGADTAISICSGSTLSLPAQFVTTGLTSSWTNAGATVTNLNAVSVAGTYQLIAGNGTACSDTALLILTVNPKPALGPNKNLGLCAGNALDLDTTFNTTGLSTSWTISGAPVANPSQANTSGVYQLIASASGCADTALLTVTVNAVPVLGIDTTINICPGSGANLTTLYNTTGLTSAWSIGGFPIANPASVNLSGVYDLVVKNASGCTDTAHVTITINPSLNLGPDKAVQICTGGSLDLNSQFGSVGLTLTWTSGGSIVSNPAAVTVTGTYQLVADNGSGCVDTALVIVTTNVRPNLGPNLASSICPGYSIDLTVLYNTAGLVPVWTIGGNPVTNPAIVTIPGVYQLVASNSSSCIDTALVTVTVIPKPNLGADRVVRVCPGAVVNLTTQYNTAGLITSWTFGGVPVPTPTAVTDSGVYQLIAYNTGASCADTALVAIRYNPKPFLGADKAAAICQGRTLNLTTQFAAPGLVQNWTMNSIPVTTPTAVSTPGIYQLIVANSNGCPDTALLTLTVNLKPDLGADQSVSFCPGSSLNLFTVYDTTGVTSVWTLGITTIPNVSTIVTPGTYQLIVTTPNGCKDTARTTVIRNIKPALGADRSITICPGSMLDLSALYNTVGLTAAWNIGGNPVPDSSAVAVAGVYQLIVTSASGCRDTAVVNLSINSHLNLGADTTVNICAGKTINLTNLFVTSGLNTNWTSGGSPVANPSAIGMVGLYQLIADNGSGCKDTALVTVAMASSPVLGADAVSSFCPGAYFSLNTTFSTPGLVNTWLQAASPVSNADSITAPGIYTLISTNTQGCADTALLTVTANLKPSIGQDTVIAICSGNYIDLTNYYPLTGLTGMWTSGGSQLPDSSNVTAPGIYQLVATNGNGCTDTALVTLNVNMNPGLGIDTALNICPGNPINLTTLFNTAGLSTIWSTSGAPVTDSLNVTSAGIYQLIAVNGNGCADTVALTFTVKPRPALGADKLINICPGSSIGLTAQYPTTGLSTSWTIGGSPVANASSVNQAGVYQLIATNVAGCSDTALITIVVTPRPALGIDKKITICTGAVVNLYTQFDTTGLTSIWTLNNVPVANPGMVTVAGTYQLVAANIAACADTALVTILQNPAPVFGADKMTFICPGATINLDTLYDTTGLAATWTIGNSPVIVTTTIATDGTYQLIGINTFNCADTALLTLVVQPVPVLGADTSIHICPGTSLNLDTFYSTTGLINNWSIGGSAVQDPSGVTVAGTYQLISSNQAGCSDTAFVTVTIDQRPALGADQLLTVCDGKSIDLTTQYSTTGLTTAWSVNAAPVVTPSNIQLAGIYELIGTNGNGCTDTALVTLIVNQKPLLGNDTAISVCSGTSINFNNLYPTTGLVANWTDGTGTISNPTAVNVAGSYQLIVTNTTGCTDTALLVFTVHAPPSLGADVRLNACPGNTLNLYNVFDSSNLTVAWTISGSPVNDPSTVGAAGVYQAIATNANGCSDTILITVTLNGGLALGSDKTVHLCSGNNIDMTTQYTTTGLNAVWTTGGGPVTNTLVDVAGVYQLIASNNQGCADTALVTIIVDPKPTLGADTAVAICDGTSTDLTTIYNVIGFTSTWTIGANIVTTPAAVTTAGIYQLIIFNSQGCADTALVTVTVSPKPVIGNDTTISICAGNSTDLTGLFTSTGLSASWFLVGAPVANPASITVAGVYQLIGVSSQGCSDTALATVVFNPKPFIGNDSAISICSGQSVDLYPFINSGGLSLSWTSSGSPVANPALITVAGIYQAIATNNTGCSDTALLTVTVISEPSLGADQQVHVCPGTVTNLATLYNTTGLTTQWYSGAAVVTDPTMVIAGGIYELIAANANGCTDTAIVTIIIETRPNLGTDQSVNVCAGSSLNVTTLFSTSGLSTAWTTGGSNVTNPTAVSVAGVYQLIASNGPGCIDTVLLTVTLIPKPNLGQDTTVHICQGLTANLTSYYNTTGLTTTWSIGGNTVLNPSTVVTAGSYQVIVRTGNGCLDTAFVNLVTDAKPDLGNDIIIRHCEGNIINLTDSFNISGLSVQWLTGSATVTSPQAIMLPGIVQLIGINTAGCADTAIADIGFNANPVLGADTAITICSGESIDLSLIYNTTGLTTNWTENGGIIFNSTSVKLAGLYRLVATNISGCADTVFVRLTVSGRPTLGADKTASICSGQSFDLSNQFVTTGLTNTWTIGSNTVSNPVSVASAGTYQLIAINASGCSDTALVVLTVNPKPGLGIDKFGAVCPGSTLNLTAAFNTGNLATNWSFGGSAVTNPVQVSDTGIYRLIVTNSFGCTDTALFTLRFNAVPQLGQDTTIAICSGNRLTLSTIYNTTSLQTTWTNNGDTIHAPTIISTAGIYQLIATNSFGCRDTVVVRVNVTAKPALGTDTSITICSGTALNLTQLYNVTNLSPVWTFNGPMVATPSAVTLPGNYQLAVTNTFGCSDTAMVTLSLMAAPVLVITDPATGCAPSTTDITLPAVTAGSSTGVILSYWKDAAATVSLPNPATLPAGVYYINAVNNNGCSTTLPVNVAILPIPIVNAGRDTVVCFETAALLHGNVRDAAGQRTYSWSPSAGLAQPNNPVTTAAISSTTMFTLTVIANSGTCIFSVSDSILVIMRPKVVAFAGNDTNALYGMPHQLRASGGGYYDWSPANVLNNSQAVNPLATIYRNTNFILKVTDALGCVGIDSVFVKAFEGPTYYVPTAFSPNNDSHNDIFRPEPVGVKSTEWFRVFNRYGQLVYESYHWLDGWDGKFKGVDQPLGNYIWMLKGLDKFGKTIEMKGNIILVR